MINDFKINIEAWENKNFKVNSPKFGRRQSNKNVPLQQEELAAIALEEQLKKQELSADSTKEPVAPTQMSWAKIVKNEKKAALPAKSAVKTLVS